MAKSTQNIVASKLKVVFVSNLKIFPGFILLLFLSVIFSTNSKAELLELNYDGFIVIIDCERRGAIRFEYTAKKPVEIWQNDQAFRLMKIMKSLKNVARVSSAKYINPYIEPPVCQDTFCL